MACERVGELLRFVLDKPEAKRASAGGGPGGGGGGGGGGSDDGGGYNLLGLRMSCCVNEEGIRDFEKGLQERAKL